MYHLWRTVRIHRIHLIGITHLRPPFAKQPNRPRVQGTPDRLRTVYVAYGSIRVCGDDVREYSAVLCHAATIPLCRFHPAATTTPFLAKITRANSVNTPPELNARRTASSLLRTAYWARGWMIELFTARLSFATTAGEIICPRIRRLAIGGSDAKEDSAVGGIVSNGVLAQSSPRHESDSRPNDSIYSIPLCVIVKYTGELSSPPKCILIPPV